MTFWTLGGITVAISRRTFLVAAGTVMAGMAGVDSAIQLVEAAPAPRPANAKHQWCMVIDLAKCEGCRTIGKAPGCQAACAEEHLVPPGQEWITVPEKPLLGGGTFFMPSPCMHCENAPCANVCPVGAPFYDPEGLVLIDHDRCIGCRMCMAACPYDRRYFNWGDPPEVPPEVAHAHYSPEYPVPSRRGTVNKCMFCAHRLRQGKLPACVEGCPMGALYMGDFKTDLCANGHETLALSRLLSDRDAVRYKEDKGTKPRVYYLPGHGQAFGRSPL